MEDLLREKSLLIITRLGKKQRVWTGTLLMVLLGLGSQAQTYCIPAYSSGCAGYNDQVESFSTTGGTQNITNINSGCSSGSYNFYSSMTVSGTPNTVIGFTVDAFPTGDAQGFKIWVDWNGDGDFTDTGEEVWNSGNAVYTATGSFTIPSGALPITTRIRVRSNYNAVPTDDCSSESYGEAEDYNFAVLSAGPCTNPPFVGNALASQSIVCAGDPFDLSLDTVTFGTGQFYQWQISADSSLWSNMLDDTLTTVLGVTQTSTNYYRCIVTCGSSDTSGVVKVETSSTPLAAGSYTINPSLATGGTNFQSFADFLGAVECNGIGGAIVIDVAPGSGPYTDQLYIGTILGTSSTNTITINGNGNTIAPTTISSSDRGAMILEGASYMRFNDLIFDASGGGSYGYGAQLFGLGTGHVVFKRCTFKSSTTSTSSNFVGLAVGGTSTSSTSTTGDAVSFITVDSCVVEGGYYGLVVNGGSTSDTTTGNSVTNTTIQDFRLYGTYIRQQDSLIFEYNDIHRMNRMDITTFYGIYMNGDNPDTWISKNTIHDAATQDQSSTSTLYPFYITSASGTATDPIVISNNIIYNINSYGTKYGFYIPGSSDNVHIYHNSMHLGNPTSTGSGTIRGIYISSTPVNFEFYNNVLTLEDGGTGTQHTVYVSSTSADIDFNNNAYANLSSGIHDFAFFGTAYATFTDWVSGAGMDSLSGYGDPIFINSSLGDLTPAGSIANTIGADLTSIVPDDHFDVARTTTPDAGAIEYTPLPCLPPLLDSSMVTIGNIDLWFTLESDADSTRIEWGPVGYTPGTGNFAFTTGSSFTIDEFNSSALPGNTCFDVYLRSQCSGSPGFILVGPYTYCTPCNPFNAPYSASFDAFPWFPGTGTTDRGEIDPCWDRDPSGSTGSAFAWYVDDDGTSGTTTGPDADYSGTGNFLYTESSYGTTGEVATITSPMINISTISDPLLIFWYHMYGATVDYLAVDVLHNGNWDMNVALLNGESQFGKSDPWKRLVVDLNAYNNDTINIRFRTAKGGTTSDVAIDELNIVDATSVCLTPGGLDVDSTSSSNGYISWNSFGGRTATVEWGPVGFSPGTTPSTKIGTATGQFSPYTITGLSPNTSYHVYVMDSCDGTWVGPLLFTTECLSQMSGIYTVGGPVGPNNFSTLDSAVAALECGVNGPVTLRLYGKHSSSVTFNAPIVGSSETKTVTFEGANPGRADSIVADDPQAAIILSGTGNIVFRNLTLDAGSADFVVHMSNGVNNVTIDDCNSLANPTATSSGYANIVASGSQTTATTSGDNAYNITVTNSDVKGGYYGVSIIGAGSTTRNHGVHIEGNVFDNQYYYPTYINYMDTVTIKDNTFAGQRSTSAYGMRLYYSSVVDVSGNYVWSQGSYGMYLYYIGEISNTVRNQIANNMSAGDATYPIYLYNPKVVDFYHNSTSGGSYGIYISGTPEDVDMRNNIFVGGSDYAFYCPVVVSSTNLNLDYNLYFTQSSSLARLGGTTDVFSDLAAWQTAQSSFNVNSKQGNPVYMASDNLHVYGGLANNSAAVIASVTTDIDGELRSTTTPDIGADEYLPVAGDMTLLGADFIQGPCLSANDSISIDVKNLIGPLVDFSIDSLTIHFTVTGPANTSGTHVVNSGILATLDTMPVFIGGIDLSIEGTYVLNAYIDTNAVNTLTMGDTIDPAVDFDVVEEFMLDPQSYTIASTQDSVNLCVQTNFFTGGSAFFISEVCHFKYTTGEPTAGWPSYLTADDYIEITGVPGSDLGGITLEQWNTTSMMGTYTFPSGTLLSPNGTAVIAVGQLGSSVPSPADFYYHGNGTYTGTFGSGGNNGRILKDASGVIIDAVGVGSTYSFPASSGVTAADWSGTSGNHGSMSGVRLTGPDLNDASNWVLSNVIPQDPNTVNSGVPVPAATGTTGLTWYLNGVPTADTTACITVGPFTTGGSTYTYVATYTNICGTYSDTSVIVVPTGDISLVGAGFNESMCLSANDTIRVTIANAFGTAINFSNDPLTIHYDVSGPANTVGSLVLNTGTLLNSDTLDVFIGGIDVSIAGIYTLNAYLDTNAMNPVRSNDTLMSAEEYEAEEYFDLSPQSYTMVSPTDSVKVCVESNFFSGGNAFFISEVCHFKTTSGTPTAGWPSYLVADDYIEITGVPGSDLGGITLEQWSTSSLMNSHTFPSGTLLSPNGTAIIAIGQPGSSVPSPADFYYHGDVSTTFSSGGNNGRILKDASGVIIDAVGVGSTYSFPASSGVTTADWSGTSGSHSGMSGVRLTGPDLNNASNWVLSSTSPQDPNTVNSGVSVPAAAAQSGLVWTLNGLPLADTTSCIMAGPFTSGGVYTYVATFTNACGTYSDTAVITNPSCWQIPTVTIANETTSGADASWTPNATGQTYEIEYGEFGFAQGTGTVVSLSTPNYTFTGLPQNLVSEMYLRPICSPGDTGAWSGPFAIEVLPVPCEDFEVYSAGLVDPQSVLINGWLGAGGDAEVVTFGGSQALHIYDSGPSAFSDVVAELPVIDSGYWKVQFDFQLAPGFGGYYNILHSYGGTNVWAIEVLLDSNGTATVNEGTNGSGVIGTYSFNPSGWNTVIHHIDLDNDSAWIEINGVVQTWNWDFSLGSANFGDQFNAVNFYSSAPTGQTPNYYADNFCMTRVCNEPLPTLNITDIHLSVNDTLAVLEFNAHSTDADSIRWDFRNGMSESGEVVTGDFTINGSDSVTVTAYNACGDSVVVTYAFVVEGISLSEFDLDNAVNIFPNPSSGVFNLEFDRIRSAETGLVILNMLGQVIHESSLGDVASFKGEINLSNMPKGVYILQLRTGDETVTRRLTVR